MTKHIDGSPLARALFPHCPAMVKLGKAAAVTCAKNKLTTRKELAEFLAVSGQVEELLKQKNVGERTINQLFEAIGLPSPFTHRTPEPAQGSQGQAIANLIVRLDETQRQLANLATQHEALRCTVEKINDRT
jgi:hypothetical protein